MVNAKTKTSLISSVIIWDTDFYCSTDHYSSNITVLNIQTQGTTIKKFCYKKTKTKNLKLALPHTNIANFSEQEKKDKKNKKCRFKNHWWDHIKEQKRTLTTNININKTGLKKKYAHIMYYNYDKKGQYLKFCSKSLKN